jgi:Spy/CpxP family protein refolding chaperone
MLIRMYRVLTPSQRTKLEHLTAQVPKDRVWQPFVGLLPRKE